MEVLHAHCAGLDVHKDTVVACVRHMVDSKVTTIVKTFKTTTQELMALSNWLSAEGATHIAMEARGVYWKPVWHSLSDGEFELILANAADVNDVTWLADLMAHGLIRASFVPDEPAQQMRDLPRTRKQMVRERSSHVQRIQKTLENANIKLDSVVTDILSRSKGSAVASESFKAALLPSSRRSNHEPCNWAKLPSHALSFRAQR